MDVKKFLGKALEISKVKSVYMKGTFGQKLTKKFIDEKSRQYPEWYNMERRKMFESMIGRDFYGFDCIGLIKGILWDWGPEGVGYQKNSVPDINATSMMGKFVNPSKDFTKIEPGEAVYLTTHIGIYLGNGAVLEATPKWENKVQIRKLSDRKWEVHGKIPYVEYEEKIHWGEKYFNYLVENGITIHEKRYDDPITRAEVFTLIARMKGIKE